MTLERPAAWALAPILTERPADAKLWVAMTARNTQANCLAIFAAALADSGVGNAVLSPGSRSAPLILALGQQSKIHAHSVIDERSAGFFGLGIGKASGLPAVVACTSGTAAANIAPAVHEAREARTPLLLITADRPPELRAAGDNQTIDQIGVFGSAAKQITPPPFEKGKESEWASFANEIVEATVRPFPGPVHVNMPLWDPLAASADPDLPRSVITAVSPFGPPANDLVPMPSGCRVIIAGRDEFGIDSEVAHTADALGIPVIADPLSPAAASNSATLIANWDSLLRVSQWAERHRPEVILRTGDLPTSKPLREWIKSCSESGTEVIHFDPLDSGRDPYEANTARHICPLQPSLAASARGDADWLARWVQADAIAGTTIDTATAEMEELSEPSLFRTLTSLMNQLETLFVAASMPVRDLESFGSLKGGPRSVANRGANGIDGTVATAAGHAISTERPTALILGDVTFAHDVSSLAVLRDVSTPLLAIVVNNGGGAIFDGLPIAEQQDVYEEFVFTAPRLKIASACDAWGVKHRSLTAVADIEKLWNEVKSGSSPIVAELSLPRDASPKARRAIRAAVAEALA